MPAADLNSPAAQRLAEQEPWPIALEVVEPGAHAVHEDAPKPETGFTLENVFTAHE